MTENRKSNCVLSLQAGFRGAADNRKGLCGPMQTYLEKGL